MGLFNILFGKRSNETPEPSPGQTPEIGLVPDPIVRVIPEGAYTVPSLALLGLAKQARRCLASDYELYDSHLDGLISGHENLLNTPNIPELANVYETAIRTYESTRTKGAYKREYGPRDAWLSCQYNELRQALRDFLDAMPYVWYENEIQARKFNVTGTFSYGTHAQVIEFLTGLGGTYDKGGWYCDILLVGDNTPPELVEKRMKEADEWKTYHFKQRLVMEGDFPPLRVKSLRSK